MDKTLLLGLWRKTRLNLFLKQSYIWIWEDIRQDLNKNNVFSVNAFFALQDRTNNLFKQVYEQKSLKGRANDAIASACLYIACRQEGVPRTFKGQN